eukprot:TRINITY_DN2828_c0_g1_i1.p1 TRINITY_DN2828_c0_g1~~TRINITY_DN2828_c0_g1_i1.p1  ORF type:complete len:248 (+),score=74.59 TRINITY_DN2828_c0_g1_i1:58-744(+)
MSEQSQTDFSFSEEQIKQYETIFKKYDPKTEGVTEIKNFPAVLKDAGFEVSPKILGNLRTLFLAPTDTEPLTFWQFLDVLLFLSEVKNAFAKVSGNKPTVPVSSTAALWKQLGYDFKNPETYDLLSIVTDRDASGTISFDGLVGGLLFFRFALVHFSEADTSGDGALDLKEIKTKFPYLGITGVSDDQAEKLFKAADKDNSGGIDPEEFASLLISLKFPDRAAKFQKK